MLEENESLFDISYLSLNLHKLSLEETLLKWKFREREKKLFIYYFCL